MNNTILETQNKLLFVMIIQTFTQPINWNSIQFFIITFLFVAEDEIKNTKNLVSNN